MRVVLIGFMGAGKTSYGRELATLLDLPFLDLDEYIVGRTGQSIQELFEQYGEQHFRELEHATLLSLLSLPYFVLATGGGAPCYGDTINLLNRTATTVYLEFSAEDLVERLRGSVASRPLLAEVPDLLASVSSRLAERQACYRRAQHCVPLDNQATDVARSLHDLLGGPPPPQ